MGWHGEYGFMSKQKKVSEMKSGSIWTYGILWRVSCSNLCTYEEDFRCCFFPGIMLRLRCRSPSGPVLSRFPGKPQRSVAEVGETKQAATQSDHIDQGQKVFIGNRNPKCSMLAQPCKEKIVRNIWLPLLPEKWVYLQLYLPFIWGKFPLP